MTKRTINALRFALAAVAGTTCLFINDNTSSTQTSLIAQADARVGRPGTPASLAGVARRHTRRAVRRGAYYGGASVGTSAYYGGSYPVGTYAVGYSGDVYGFFANRSDITGRPAPWMVLVWPQ